MNEAAEANTGHDNPTGQSTMSSALPDAMNYHNYLLGTLEPYLGEKVWEIGSGYGQYTQMLLDRGLKVLGTDIDRNLLENLERFKKSDPNAFDSKYLDLYKKETIEDCASWNPDSVLSLNVLEHIEEDEQCVRWIYESVKPGTRIVFLVPAHQALYGFMDSDAGHFRRYSRSMLSDKFSKAGWTINKTFYMNPIGGFGWFVRNRVLIPKNANINSPEVNSDMRFFDKYLVSPTKILEKVTGPFFGQSVVIVAEK